MFIDASAIIAILLSEEQASRFVTAIEDVPPAKRVTSVLAIWEATVAIYRKNSVPMADAEAQLQQFLQIAEIAVMPIAEAENALALSAFDRYGRHRYPDGNRNSSLNLADCFHYASAKTKALPILTKDAGFALTDLETIGPAF